MQILYFIKIKPVFLDPERRYSGSPTYQIIGDLNIFSRNFGETAVCKQDMTMGIIRLFSRIEPQGIRPSNFCRKPGPKYNFVFYKIQVAMYSLLK